MLYKNRAVLRSNPRITLSKSDRVNLNAWFDSTATHNNVGDYLSLVITEHVCACKGIDPYQKVHETKHLYAIGSILPGYQDAVVWGSGFGYEKPRRWYSPIYCFLHKHCHRIDVRAVRGLETRRILLQMGISCPEIYGDPAVLMPLFYKGNGPQGIKDYVVVPHYSRLEEFRDAGHLLSTITRDYRKFIDSLLEARLVISSSLHGIILAEAYGIPAVMLCDTPSEDITKYKDWYYSTGRTEFPVARSVENALELGGTPLDYSIIQRIQTDLLDTFPVDLWDK